MKRVFVYYLFSWTRISYIGRGYWFFFFKRC